MRFSSARASLWLAVFVAVVMVLPAVSLTVGAAYTYQTNLAKIDPGVLTQGSSDTPSVTSTAGSAPNAASPTIAVIKLKDFASPTWASSGHDFVVDSLEAVATRSQDPIANLVVNRGGTVLHRFWLTNSLLVATNADTLRDIAQNPIVERIHANFALTLPPTVIGHPEPTANQSYDWNIAKVNAPGAWALGIRGEGVRVCVTDTGIDPTHPDLAGRLYTTDSSDPAYPGGWMEFDGSGNPVFSTPHDTEFFGIFHGTHVSGTIAGDSTSGSAIGVAPGAWLMMGLVLPNGSGSFAQVIAGMEWCVSPFDRNGNPTPPGNVQSMSWGGYPLDQNALIDPVRNSLLAGVVPVAASGNEGLGNVRSPGDIWGVFGIGATDINDNIADFSGGKTISWASPPADWPFFPPYPSSYVKPDFSAPGVDVRSTQPGGGYAFLSGTSMATPHVSATVALMLQASGFSLSPERVYQNLQQSVVDLGVPGQDERFGYGRLDTAKAVTLSLILNTGVRGVVYDSQSASPVANVTVTAVELGAFTKTAPDGSFKLSLPEGSYNISFAKFGYLSQLIPVVVKLYNGTIAGYVTDLNLSPIAGANVWIVQANVNVTTDVNGFFTASLKAGHYDLLASASGFVPSNATLDLKENETSWANFTLAPNIPGIVSGTVTYASNSTPAPTTLIWAEGPGKYQALTDASGSYSLQIDSFNAGSYRVGAFKGGFWPPSQNITVVPGSSTTLDFSIVASSNTSIAVYQDWQGELAGLLSSAGYTPYDFQAPDAIALKWSLSAFPVVYWSGFSNDSDLTAPAQSTFVDILSLANALGVSMIFGDSYWYWPYGITLLSAYTGNPPVRIFDFGEGSVYFSILQSHPIFAGVGAPGDSVTVILNTNGTIDGDHTWFTNFTGTTLAQVGTNMTGIQGDSVAVEAQAGGTQWVLLGGLAPQFWTHVSNDWTSAAVKIFDNSVAWAASYSWATGLGTGLAKVKSDPVSFGLSTAGTISPMAFVDLTVYLVQLPSGSVAGTVADTDGSPIGDVQIRATGTPVQTVTDANGQYSIVLPVGNWTITAKKFGYQSGQGTATVTEGQTTTLDFVLVAQRRVGIMYDDQGNPLQTILDATGRFAVAQYQGNWDDLIAAAANLDLIILSGRPFNSVFPTADQFNALLAAADASGAGILFLDSVYGFSAPYGVVLLNQFRGDPAVRTESWPCAGDIWQGGVAAHPVLRGRPVGYYTRLTNMAGCFPMAWFSGFSGKTIGDLWTGMTSASQRVGDNLAVKVTDAGSRWVLMGSYAPIFGFANFYWTQGIAQILVNASLWASTERLQLAITPGSGAVGTHISLTGSGARANANLQALFDEDVVGTLVANSAGAFSGSFDVPEAVFGAHSVVVQTLDENFAGERPFRVAASLVLTATSGPPGSGVGVAGHGWPSRVYVDLSFGSTSSGRALSGADGSFVTLVIVPTVVGGDYFISGFNLDTGASASSAFRVIEKVALDVQVSVGTLHFPGEVAEFYILVTAQGTLRAATISASLWRPAGTSDALNVTEVAIGLYKVPYTLPGTLGPGTYALVAQASVSETFLTGSGSGLATFLVSQTLTAQYSKVVAIQGDIAQIKTDTGTIRVDLTAVSAKLESIQGDTATISTSIGTLTANLAALDGKITSINGNVATVQTTLGAVTATLESLNGKITTIQGDVATIKTNAGTANQQLTSLQSSSGLLAMSSASVAAILSAVAAIFALAAWRAARRPKT